MDKRVGNTQVRNLITRTWTRICGWLFAWTRTRFCRLNKQHYRLIFFLPFCFFTNYYLASLLWFRRILWHRF